MDARARNFEKKMHRPCTDVEFYLLWNSPAALDAAQRFSNLVSSNQQL
jgi:hypothetical protein